MTHPSDGLFTLSDSIPLCSTASLSLLAGFISSYLPQYLCHRRPILLYTPHVSTHVPQPSAGQYTVQSNSFPFLNLHRQKTVSVKIDQTTSLGLFLDVADISTWLLTPYPCPPSLTLVPV